MNNLDNVDSKTHILIKGAKSNNLKNVDLAIPRNQLVVITGVSGSGKSSITMDTLYAEGQRRYVESLSSYARQFLMRMKKPDVEYIKGVCPAIAIEQKVTTGNSRSTVGSMTEIYEYLRLLFARVGVTYSPISGEVVKKHQVSDVVDFILKQKEGSRVQLFIPLQHKYLDRTLAADLNLLMQKGYTRLQIKGIKEIDDSLIQIEDFLQDLKDIPRENIRVLIDRFVVNAQDEENTKRIADSIQTAFYESEGEAIVEVMGESGATQYFNNRFELDGIQFVEPTPQLFNYNNPMGACPKCEGYGRVMGIDTEKVVPNPALSVYEGAIACWKGEKSSEWQEAFLKSAHLFDFPIHRSYEHLTKEEKRLLWKGNQYFRGIDDFFKELEAQTYKIQSRVMLARYRGKTQCPTCEGSRLRPEARYVKVANTEIGDLMNVPIDEVLAFFQNIQLSPTDAQIAKRLLLEIQNRLRFMIKVGLGYLTLERISSTLSGGETQRINLTRTLGSNLTSSMYILDEPSVGLHPRDTERLVEVLKELRDLGNTVVVVEHEEDLIKNADFLVDMGPEAGINGGEVVFAGKYSTIDGEAADRSLTAQYMNGKMEIPVPAVRRKAANWLQLNGARQHNLKNVSVRIPLNVMTVVSGVSGSGKTTLVKQILAPALQRQLDETTVVNIGNFDGLTGDTRAITALEIINQSPIGKSSRSNPVTYVKAYDDIRDIFQKQQLAKIRGYKAGFFSFNTEGGRCEACKGEGVQVVEMQFLADVNLECEECRGKRFKAETLEVTYKGKNISDVLEMSIDEAIVFFKDDKNIAQKLQPLANVGLGYVKLGQASSTLSGGEAQRVKLASFLVKEKQTEKIFFIFDEPTTGLHFHDVRKLLDALNALVEKGHTVVVVEHNMEVIKSADYVIDLGPDGGKLGGTLVYEGTPEGLAACETSLTGKYLKEKI